MHMNCPRCQQSNRPERSFCAACGESLRAVPCEFCGFVNQPAERYCGGCGRMIATMAPERMPAESEPPRLLDTAVERRQLTALFCDLVDSTALSERLDPEELRVVLEEYHAAVTHIIQRFDGYIQSYSGDGLLVYYGYPRAHEDDPQRALRTGLEMIAALPELNARITAAAPGAGENALAMRIGVHTGPVVVGEMARGAARDLTAIGRTLNVAARV